MDRHYRRKKVIIIKLRMHLGEKANPLVNNDAIAARSADLVLLLLLIGRVGVAAAGLGVISAAGTATVKSDAVSLAGDTVTLTGAAGVVRVGRAVAGGGAGRRGVGAVGEGRSVGGDGRGGETGDDVLLVEAGGTEAGSELGDLVIVVSRVEDVLVATGRDGLGSLDLGDGERAALGDLSGGVTGALGRGLGRAGVLGRALGGRGLGRRRLAGR